jgi:vacuolar-type H+-ATPase subunit C/Vma6
MRQELASASGHSLRKKYFNNLGHLYPGRTQELNNSKEYKDLLDKLEGTSYHGLM